ncbi:MAG: periplasmic heavy metal sensor [Hyphomonas sp.]|nr:periplasmic heavy metal sensor [Hyphomonas sp.]
MTETPTPPRTRHVPFWLVISLMANMMLVGLFAGMFLRSGPKPHEAPHRKPPIAWVSHEGDRMEVAAVMRQAFEASEEERSERIAARKALADALGKDPYNADAVRTAFAGLRAADMAVHAATHEEMVEQFASLPVEERVRMAEILTRGPMTMMPRGERRNLRSFIVRTDRVEDDGVQVIEERQLIGPGDEDE